MKIFPTEFEGQFIRRIYDESADIWWFSVIDVVQVQRMTGQETRNKLTDYWSEHDIKKGSEFAILTNIIHQEWAGVSVAEHKDMKGLSSSNLRDHMSEAELIFTALAELSTRQIAESVEATGMTENKTAAKSGGNIAAKARNLLESQTGKSVVTSANYLPPVVPKVAKAVKAIKPPKKA